MTNTMAGTTLTKARKRIRKTTALALGIMLITITFISFIPIHTTAATTFGCAFVIIHHSPKLEYEELVNRAAGSSIVSRWADVIIGIKRVSRNRKDPRRQLEFVSNSGDEPDSIDVTITDTGLEDKTGQVQNKLWEAILKVQEDLKNNPDVKVTKRLRELQKGSNIGMRTFWEAWDTLNP